MPKSINPKWGCAKLHNRARPGFWRNSVGVVSIFVAFTQGGSCLATLGWRAQPRWGSKGSEGQAIACAAVGRPHWFQASLGVPHPGGCNGSKHRLVCRGRETALGCNVTLQEEYPFPGRRLAAYFFETATRPPPSLSRRWLMSF
jgi:hypothetical protein